MKRRAALLPAFVSSLGFLDVGATVVVLPQLAVDLGLGLREQSAVLSTALLAIGALVLSWGAIADAVGRKRVMAVGLAVAAVASATTATAGEPLLLLSRLLFGVGAAMFLPAALAAASGASDHARLRAWVIVTSAVTLLSPAIGGLALGLGSWRLLYLGESATALALLIAVLLSSDLESGTEQVGVRRAHLTLLVLGTITLVLLITPLPSGLRKPGLVLTVAGGLFVLAGWLRGHLHTRLFVTVSSITCLAYAAFSATPFLLSLYLQNVVGLSGLVVGLILAIDGLVVVLLSARLGRVGEPQRLALARVGYGAAACAVAVLTMALATERFAVPAAVLGLAALGVGGALFIAPLTDLSLRAMRAQDAGLAAGVSLALARVAAAVGLGAASAVVLALGGVAPSGLAITEQSMMGAPYRGALGGVAAVFSAAALLALLARPRAVTRQRETAA